jgi:hypothetical protein
MENPKQGNREVFVPNGTNSSLGQGAVAVFALEQTAQTHRNARYLLNLALQRRKSSYLPTRYAPRTTSSIPITRMKLIPILGEAKSPN